MAVRLVIRTKNGIEWVDIVIPADVLQSLLDGRLGRFPTEDSLGRKVNVFRENE